MPSQNPGRRLRDILEHVDLVRTWIDGMDLEEFAHDTENPLRGADGAHDHGRGRGGASGRNAPALPARSLAGLADIGNTFRHQYWTVEHQITWAGLQNELAPLEEAVRRELARLGER